MSSDADNDMSAPDNQLPDVVYDVLICGTSLTSTILANYYSRCHKSVLHIDVNSYYGSHNATLTLTEFMQLSDANAAPHDANDNDQQQATNSDDTSADIPLSKPSAVSQHYQPRYTNFYTIHNTLSADVIKAKSRHFNIDLDGTSPYLHSRADIVDAMTQCSISHYVQFQTIHSIQVYDASPTYAAQQWRTVPHSKAAVFTDSALTATDKYELIKLLGVVLNDGEKYRSEINQLSSRPSDAYSSVHEMPVVDYLRQYRRMSDQLCNYVVHAIALINAQPVISVTTREGLARVKLYLTSINRYSDSGAALLYPIYGMSELTQSYARNAAVHGCTYMLRQPVKSVTMSDSQATGIRLHSGDVLRGKLLLIDSSMIDSSMDDASQLLNCVCIANRPLTLVVIDQSLQHKDAPSLFIIPPHTAPFNNSAAIQIQQLTNNTQSAPAGFWLLRLTCVRSNDMSTQDIKRVLDILYEDASALLYAATYIQHISGPAAHVSHGQLSTNAHLIYDCLSLSDSLTHARAIFDATSPDIKFDDVLNTQNENSAPDSGSGIYQIVQPSSDAMDELDAILN